MDARKDDRNRPTVELRVGAWARIGVFLGIGGADAYAVFAGNKLTVYNLLLLLASGGLVPGALEPAVEMTRALLRTRTEQDEQPPQLPRAKAV